jgi:general secretion pathway protein H
MTLIELVVVILIIGIAVVVAAVALGGITGAKLGQASGDVSTAVRYTYNLAAINNRTYALYLDLDKGTYRAGPLNETNECERVLLSVDGRDTDPMIMRYGKQTVDEDSEEPASLFGGLESGGDGEVKPPGWLAADKSSPAARLQGMLSAEVKDVVANERAEKGITGPDPGEGLREQKKIKTWRKNQLGKPRPLPRGVSFGGVVLREGQEPVTTGTVPILFYPNGYTQRALIYLDTGNEENGERFTVEIMTYQGMGKIHDFGLDPSDFAEETQ